MESLGEILRRITEKNTLRHTAGGVVTFPEDPEPDEVCPDCDGAGWVGRAVSVGHPDFGQAFPCRCQNGSEPAARIAKEDDDDRQIGGGGDRWQLADS